VNCGDGTGVFANWLHWPTGIKLADGNLPDSCNGNYIYWYNRATKI
jgi:hypothetical protein